MNYQHGTSPDCCDCPDCMRLKVKAAADKPSGQQLLEMTDEEMCRNINKSMKAMPPRASCVSPLPSHGGLLCRACRQWLCASLRRRHHRQSLHMREGLVNNKL